MPIPEDVLNIKFAHGINRLEGAPLDSMFNIENARLDPYNEVKAYREGTDITGVGLFPDGNKPWFRYNNRWYTGSDGNAFAPYRGRLFASHYINERFVQILSNGFTQKTKFADITLFSASEHEQSYADTDDIKGITFEYAADYILIPYDEYGQPGRWYHYTARAETEDGGGDPVKVSIFAFNVIGINISRIEVYKTIEYDIAGTDGNTINTGGYYFEGAFEMQPNGATYVSESYWPYNLTTAIDPETDIVGTADPLGAVLNVPRNVLDHNIADNVWKSLYAKTLHMDSGVLFHGNVKLPTAYAIPSSFDNSTGWPIMLQYEYETPAGRVYGPDGIVYNGVDEVVVPWRGETALLVWAKPQLAIVNAVAATDVFQVAGDWEDHFIAGRTLVVTGSTGNDGTYTVTSSTFGGVNTTIAVNEDVTSDIDDGTLYLDEFVLWERLTLDGQGRYTSHNPVKANILNVLPYAFKAPAAFAATFIPPYEPGPYTPTDYIQLPDHIYMSMQNAPWTPTFNNVAVPDGSTVRKLITARQAEEESLISYQFYVMTDKGVYIAKRGNVGIYDLTMDILPGAPGVQIGIDNEPIAIPARGGVVYLGVDEKLYFLAGRQYQQIDYEKQDWFNNVNDIAYVESINQLAVICSLGICYYDFDRGEWIGNRPNGANNNDRPVKHQFEAFGAIAPGNDIDTITVTEDTFMSSGTQLFVTDPWKETYVLTGSGVQEDLKTLTLFVDRDAGGTDTAGVYEYEAISGRVTLTGGELFTGGVDLFVDDVLRLEYTSGSGSLASGDRFHIYSIIFDGTPQSGTVERITYSPATGTMFLIGSFTNGFYQSYRDNGPVIEDTVIETQPIRSSGTIRFTKLKVDYDPVQHGGSYVSIAGSSNVGRIGSDDFPADVAGGIIWLENATFDNFENVAHLNSVIVGFVNGANVTIADTIQITQSGNSMIWGKPANITLFSEINITRDYSETFKVPPNRNRYPRFKGRNIRMELTDFETLREIFILVQRKLEFD